MGTFRLFRVVGCRVTLRVFGLMTTLRSLRLLEELIEDLGDVLQLTLGMVSVDGTEVHETDVPLPLSDELFGTLTELFCLFLVRFATDVFRFLAFGRFLTSFRRSFEVFLGLCNFRFREHFLDGVSDLTTLSASLSELSGELELRLEQEELLRLHSVSEVELSSELSLLLSDGVG